MLREQIDCISLEDIKSLIDNSVCENKMLDYKRELHIETDSDKKEFLADISSFANSTGGDIIFGIEEDAVNKIPINIVGITYDNEDKLIRKLEDLIRQSIQPVILNIEYKVIEIKKDICILIVRIPQSIIAPHRVEFKGHNKFYTRNNKGKYQMDVSELRIAFNSGLELDKRIENFKMDRYYQLLSNKYNKFPNDSPILVVHYIPISAFSLNNKKMLNLANIKDEMNNCSSKALGCSNTKQISMDGICIDYKNGNHSSMAKYKIDGIIEKASVKFFRKDYEFTDISPSKTINYINGYQILNTLIDDFNEVKRYYEKIGIHTPIIVSYAILNAFGYTIPTKDWHDVLNTIDRELLCIENLYIESLEKNVEELLQPTFDAIWNACGYEKCPAYDKDNMYVGLK